MSFTIQTGLTVFVVICVGALAVRYHLATAAIIADLGFPTSLIALATIDETKTVASSAKAATGGPGRRGSAGRTAVVVTSPAKSGTLNDRLEAIGNGDSLKSVSVVPLQSGVLTEVAVVSGGSVKAGDVLARLNSQGEEVAREQAVVTLKAAEEKLARYQALRKSNVATEVELDELQTAYDTARLALKEAEVNLELRSIFAPIDGVVGIVPVELGNYITTTTEIAMIDDRSTIIVDFWVPERFAGLVRIGQAVEARSFAFANEIFRGEVSAIGSRVESDNRTLQIQARIANNRDRLRPGMSFLISMDFDGNQFPAVDPLAVQWDSEGSYVWKVVNDKARRTSVRIVQRNPESVLVDGDLKEGVNVIIQGLLALRDGATVGTPEPASSEPEKKPTRPEGPRDTAQVKIRKS